MKTLQITFIKLKEPHMKIMESKIENKGCRWKRMDVDVCGCEWMWMDWMDVDGCGRMWMKIIKAVFKSTKLYNTGCPPKHDSC